MIKSKVNKKFIQFKKLTNKGVFYLVFLEFAFNTLLPVISAWFYIFTNKFIFIMIILVPFFMRLYYQINDKENRIYLNDN